MNGYGLGYDYKEFGILQFPERRFLLESSRNLDYVLLTLEEAQSRSGIEHVVMIHDAGKKLFQEMCSYGQVLPRPNSHLEKDASFYDARLLPINVAQDLFLAGQKGHPPYYSTLFYFDGADLLYWKKVNGWNHAQPTFENLRNVLGARYRWLSEDVIFGTFPEPFQLIEASEKNSEFAIQLLRECSPTVVIVQDVGSWDPRLKILGELPFCISLMHNCDAEDAYWHGRDLIYHSLYSLISYKRARAGRPISSPVLALPKANS